MTTFKLGPIGEFIEHHYRHFNAAALKDAAKGFLAHNQKGHPMLLTMAGAMSTAELGISVAELIRQDKIQAISCTGANLEEDLYNLVAHDHYERIPGWRTLTEADEEKLLNRHLNRVTDTCIPEEQAIRVIEGVLLKKWQKASEEGKSYLPHEYFTIALREGLFKPFYQIDPKNSWLLAAAEKNIPIFVPGWEDSTTGNIFAGHVLQNNIKRSCLLSGIDYMISISKWYKETCKNTGIGFFQIGGGIAGDFPICVVPMLEQDMGENVPKWNYFCQISDSTTSYGSYSGATPSEKITWGKLSLETPKFIIESDATIVAPLVFAYILGK